MCRERSVAPSSIALREIDPYCYSMAMIKELSTDQEPAVALDTFEVVAEPKPPVDWLMVGALTIVVAMAALVALLLLAGYQNGARL